MNELGDTIRIVREQYGISQRELGRRIGKSGTYIAKLENGTRLNPSLEVISLIANEFGLMPYQLLGEVNSAEDTEKLNNIISPYIEPGYKFLIDLGYSVSLKKDFIDGDLVCISVNIITPHNEEIVLSKDSYNDLLNEFKEFVEFKLSKLKTITNSGDSNGKNNI